MGLQRNGIDFDAVLCTISAVSQNDSNESGILLSQTGTLLLRFQLRHGQMTSRRSHAPRVHSVCEPAKRVSSWESGNGVIQSKLTVLDIEIHYGPCLMTRNNRPSLNSPYPNSPLPPQLQIHSQKTDSEDKCQVRPRCTRRGNDQAIPPETGNVSTKILGWVVEHIGKHRR